jgi:hypothetical protein
MSKIHYATTQYGFEWGASNVIRHCADDRRGWVIIGLDTPKHAKQKELQIYVTKTGKVRIFSANGEWKAPKVKA